MTLLLLAACTRTEKVEETPVDLLTFLSEPGPYSVGHRDDTLSRSDPISGTERSLHLATWYPTHDTEGTTATYFLGSREAKGVWQDATPADGAFPVIVFSHGTQGFGEYSSFLMEHLASHGWVVSAPDHTGNTILDDATRTTEIYAQRSEDLSAVLDWIDAGTLPVSDLRIAFGHSFGGYTVLASVGATFDPAALDCPDPTTEFCSTMTPALRSRFEAGFLDSRFRSALVMAPGDFGLFGTAGVQAIEVPVFHMTASEDQRTGSVADDLWAALQGGENRRLILEGAGHQSFTDFANQLEHVPMPADEGFEILDSYGLAWALRSNGDEQGAAVLDGERIVSEDATLLR